MALLFSVLLILIAFSQARKTKLEEGHWSKYPYVALLLNNKNRKRTCVGVIITTRWILDNCPEENGLPYQFALVGLNRVNYAIEKAFSFEEYRTKDITIEGYDTRNLYAAVYALFLHKTIYNIEVRLDVRPIPLNLDTCLPRKARAIYLQFNGEMEQRGVELTTRSYCNDDFTTYSSSDPLKLEQHQFCVKPKDFTVKECIFSQSIIISKDTLLGIMAWSTVCDDKLGVHPWVVTNVGFFLDWIEQHSDWNQSVVYDIKPHSFC